MIDTIVIGSGLAGLAAATRLAQAGQSVTLLTFGLGGIQLGQGTVDVLGYATPGEGTPAVTSPFDELPAFVAAHPAHPYAQIDVSRIKAAVDWLAGLVPDVLVPGDGLNHPVPTALGAMRPTYLTQPSMVWPNPASVAVAGPRQLKDFYPELVAANLVQTAAVEATGYHIDLPVRDHEADCPPLVLAAALEEPSFFNRFADLVARTIGDEDAVCVPAVLGLRTTDLFSRLSEALGRPVVETILPPPSIPGMRLNEALTRAAKAAGVRIVLGSKVTSYSVSGDRLTGVTLAQAGRDKTYSARNIVYAPGGFESGALVLDSYGKVHETLFGLPLAGLDGRELITGDYWADQALFAVGVRVDTAMRPADAAGKPVADNLYAAGGILGGAIPWTEKSGDGIAVATAVTAADSILGSENA